MGGQKLKMKGIRNFGVAQDTCDQEKNFWYVTEIFMEEKEP